MEKLIIIVGAGIAGLSITKRLEEENIPYLIIDSGENHSSKIAAGIINPVVFRRMALSWRIHDFLPEAKDFYKQLEKQFESNFFHKISIRRAFAHQQEVDLWEKKLTDPLYDNFLKPISEEDLKNQTIHHSCGTGVVKESYWIDTKLLLEKWQSNLKSEGKLTKEKFDYTHIDFENCLYKDIAFDKIIFCEGYQGLQNPYFSYLPLQATKGELLTVKNDFMPENESYNYKCFVLPMGNKTFKVGATYTWNTPNVDLTEEAKTTLETHFKNLISSPYTVLKHEAGVRPTVLDRRPLLGVHPKHENLFIYNGLGAKGYLITPKLSQEFVGYIKGELELDKEVDIRRYEKLNTN